MLVDLNGLRPKNESYEHFILKQVGRAWLFEKKGVRAIGCEVHLQGQDISPYGEKKIVDVVGIERKRKQVPSMRKLYEKIHNIAIELGKPAGLTQEMWGGRHNWINVYKLRGEERSSKEVSIAHCYENACESLGMPREAYKRLKYPYQEVWTLNQIECKATLSDYKNGYSLCSEVSYILAPVGVIPVEELPKKVGLLEFDFDKFHSTRDWQKAIKVKKKSRKEYDSQFLKDTDDPKSVDLEYHEQFCRDLLYSISQESTEELVFWNPFLRNIPDGGTDNPEVNWRFKYKAGDVTPLGIVIDRRIGEKTKADLEAEALNRNVYYSSRFIAFYKLVQPGVGITKWTSQRIIEEAEFNNPHLNPNGY